MIVDRMLEIPLRVRVDHLGRDDRALGRPARGVADPRRVVADDQDSDVPLVLEGSHPLERNSRCRAWISGAVTSIPSFTRSGRPSASLCSSSPSGSTLVAFRVSSARPMGTESRGRPKLESAGSVTQKEGPRGERQAPSPHPQASSLHPPAPGGPVRLRVVRVRAGDGDTQRVAAARPGALESPTRAERLHLRLEREASPRGAPRLGGACPDRLRTTSRP